LDVLDENRFCPRARTIGVPPADYRRSVRCLSTTTSAGRQRERPPPTEDRGVRGSTVQCLRVTTRELFNMQERHTPTLLETALQHDRRVTLVVLVAIPLASWAWIAVMARDMYGTMSGASAWMMTTVWDWPHILLLWAMWTVMMTAMMLPTATPLILLYAAAARSNAETGSPARRVYALAAGYVLVWCAFSVLATALQRILASALVLTPMMETSTPVAGAIVVAVAGAYQLTPLKRACLRACRSPLAFMVQQSRGGTAGAFRLGISHGAYCLGCCWALMLILFAGGVMNLAVIITITVWVLVEKIAPFGEQTPTASGVALLAIAVWMGIG
jgi:predicted metal-binding membrane protein